MPLLDTQQLIEDDERENQFILNYVAKAKKFLDHDKVLEMVSVLKKYKDNVKEVSNKRRRDSITSLRGSRQEYGVAMEGNLRLAVTSSRSGRKVMVVLAMHTKGVVCLFDGLGK